MGCWRGTSSHKDFGLYVESILCFLKRAFLPEGFVCLRKTNTMGCWGLPPTRFSVCKPNQDYELLRRAVLPQGFRLVRWIKTMGCWGGPSSHRDFGLYVKSILRVAEEGLPPTRISVCTSNQYYELLRKAFLSQGFLFVRWINTMVCWGVHSSCKDFGLYVESILWFAEKVFPPTRTSVCT